MRPSIALVAQAPGDTPSPGTIQRRDLRPDDVAVRVTYCGVCHTDLHSLGSAEAAAFPMVPGHEFVGEVSAVGAEVTAFSVGDPVAVGNIVDSCGRCAWCQAGEEAYCTEFPTLTYGGTDRHDGSRTMGAYSSEYVARERFVHPRPPELDPAGVAPLLCAGITVWQPLRAADVGPGTRVGVVGIGGLGHLAVRLARALGAEVTAFTTSAAKVADAERLGATRVVLSDDEPAMADVANSLDVVIDTIAAEHALEPYLAVVAADGVLYSVGHLGPVTLETMALLVGRKRLSSSGSGGVDRTRELLDFCGEHGITADVEVVAADRLPEALDRLRRNDVRYRFVLDTSTLEAVGRVS